MPKPWNAAEYLATYQDLQAAYRPDPFAASWHWQHFGQAEGRVCGFDGLDYIAGYADLRSAFGANPWAGAMRYVQHGRLEARADTFDGAQYLANYADLRAAFGSDETAAAQHFIIHGAAEGRTDDAPAVTSDADTAPVTLSPVPGQMIVGTDTADTLVGTPGDDTIHGGNAQDTMAGGDGADIFTFGSRWTPAPAPKMWDGGDRITDFQPGMDKLDFSALISAKGYDGAFVGADGFSTNPPIPRDFNSYQFIHGSFEDVEVGYRHERMSDGSEATTVVLDGPVHIGSAKFNLTPMDGNVDARVTLVGVHTLTAGDVIL